MPKRERRGRRGQGSIVERDGRYLARRSTTENGVRKRKAKTFGLRNEAEWWLSQSRRNGETPADITVAEHMERWLAGKRQLRESTHRAYAEHIAVHIVPVLGKVKLQDLKRRHVEAFVTNRESYVSEKTHKPLSPSMVGKVLFTLRTALSDAVPHDIPDNPAARVHGPRVQRANVPAMTPTDATNLFDVVRDTWLEHIVRVLLGSGMRLGEALALNQGDVHDGWVSLRQSKTTLRAVRLSRDADTAIHDAIRAAPRRGDDEPVFFSPRRRRGGQLDRMHGYSVTHALPEMMERSGLAPLTPHKLRHGTATLMVRGGVPMRAIAEQLGHANPAVTANIYAHVAPDSMQDAVKVLDDAISER